MKRFTAIILAALLVLTAIPAMAKTETKAARTELLDLTAYSAPASNSSEGWSYDPTGRDGQPLLTLTNYGTEDSHSAPILTPANTTIVVNGDNYLDNACIGANCDVLSGSYDGFLRIEGSGTLNIFALAYHGRGISVPAGGENDNTEFLYVNDTTINIHSMERQNNTASQIREGIYANHAIEFRNATINVFDGTKAIAMQGITPIGGVNEENCNELLIENSEININLNSTTNLWNNASGINTTWGRIRMRNSDVTINGGTDSIYSYLSTVIESGSLNVVSTPASTVAALVYVGCLKIGAGVENVYMTATRYPGSKVLRVRTSGASELASGLEMALGTFENGDFTTAQDPDNNNMPGLKIIPGEPADYHTVSFYGFDGSLIEAVEVPDGGTAVAPEVPGAINNDDGTWLFYGWDTEFSNVTSDLEVHADYVLLGDANLTGDVNVTDALLVLRASMDIVTLSEKQLLAGDINSDGNPDATDALLILRYAMQVIDSLA